MNSQPAPREYVPPQTKPVWSPLLAVVVAGFGTVILGLFGLGRAVAALSGLRSAYDRWAFPEPVEWKFLVLQHQVDLAVGAVLAVLLGLGGALVLARRTRGLTMVIIGSGLAIFALWGAGAMSISSGTLVTYVLYSLGPCGVLIAALLPAGQRWVDSRTNTQPAPPNNPRPAVPPYN